MARFVLSGYYGFKNFGDEAILSVLVNKLQQNRHSLTIITSNPEYTKSQYKHIRAVKTFDFSNIIPAIYKSDFLISGGGSLLQDSTSKKSLLYYLFIIFLALILNKKVIIFAQGIGPIKSFIGKILTKNILKHCTYLSVRDNKSHELLKTWGISADLVCDPIFSTITDNVKEDIVAVQLRACKNLNNDFLDRLAEQINNNFHDKKIEIYSFQDNIDLEICKNFEQKLKMLNDKIETTVYSNLTNNAIIEKLSRAKYVIAMRFHAIIIGLIAQSKTMGINYDIKVEKIAKEFCIPLIDLHKSFGNEFNDLMAQDIFEIHKITSKKIFDWSGFDNAIK